MGVDVVSEQCVAVSFYGIAQSERSLAGFYHDIVEWTQEIGLSVDKVSMGRHGRTGKATSLARTDSKLRKTGFGGITGLDVFSLLPDAQIPIRDYLLTACCSAKHAFAFIVLRSSIAPLSRDGLLPFFQKIIRDVQPAYGIGYTRDHRYGPAMYAIGICQGFGRKGYGVDVTPAERAEKTRISRWGDGMTARVWEKGILRDVFPWNFLNHRQLSMEVANTSLEGWIRQDAERGTLDTVQDGLTLWEIPETLVPPSREILRESGVIFDWKKHL